MTDYIKRIQSALQRKVSVTRKQIKQYMEEVGIDPDSPSDDEIEAVKYYFLDMADEGEEETALSITPEAVLEEIEQPILGEIPEAETVSDSSIGETAEASTVNSLAVNPEIRGMVHFKAGAMGIQLAENQIDVIASQIDSTGSSFSQTIAEIEAALVAYVDYQHSQEARQVDSMLERVTGRVAQKNQAISHQLSDGITRFTDDLTALEREQKKIAGSILARLSVPSV